MNIASILDQLNGGHRSARDVVLDALQRAELDENRSVLHIVRDRALERADEIDRRRAAGETLGKLAGVPFIAKDNILTLGSPTTASAKILEPFVAPFQATAIERLESAGAICIGKANLDAFAHGGSTENSYFGPTLNPHDKTKVPGGSSGGSAAAVAAGIVPFALGTDTGGSIRQPASFCGVVGHKPSYGAVSRYGVIAMASSTDVVGPIATTVEDVSLVNSVLYGQDDKDATTLADYYEAGKHDKAQLKIGVIEEVSGDGVDEEVAARFERTLEMIRKRGHVVERVSLPSLLHSLAVYYIIVPAEISSNLARYDGVRYGSASKNASSLKDLYENTRSEGFMEENQRRILIGNYVLSSGYYDAYYKKAQTVRTMIVDDFKNAFKEYDALVSPTAPTTAFGIGEKSDDPLTMYLSDVMTVPASLAGIPAISVPMSCDDKQMPAGIQLLAPFGSDVRLMNVAEIFEEASGGK